MVSAPVPDFVCLDLETANADLASICQVGIVRFHGVAMTQEWSSLVDPRDYFDPWNVGIHGIDAATVAGAPTFGQVADEIHGLLAGSVVVCHTHFDRSALSRASERVGVAPAPCDWLDSARVVRRTWAEFAQKGYGLANVCERLGILFRHHDALEDARAAGQVILRAIAETGLDVAGLLARSRQRIWPEGIAAGGNPDGLFYGHTVAFTGALAMPRRQAAELATSAGCNITDGVTRHTTLLVVGDQDVRKLAGHDKSSKHRKAEQLRALGQDIRIVGESDFVAMLAQAERSDSPSEERA